MKQIEMCVKYGRGSVHITVSVLMGAPKQKWAMWDRIDNIIWQVNKDVW